MFRPPVVGQPWGSHGELTFVPNPKALERGTEMLRYIAKLQTKIQSDRGATAVEYGLMVALIAVAIIATVTLLGKQLSALFASVTAVLP